jgi:hypothetical protein
VIIFTGWDASRAAFMRTLTLGGVICVPIIVGNGPPAANIPGHWIESGQLGRDLRRLPTRLWEPI